MADQPPKKKLKTGAEVEEDFAALRPADNTDDARMLSTDLVAKMAELLGATSTSYDYDATGACIAFDHPHRFVRPEQNASTPGTLMLVSRESSHHMPIGLMMYQNVRWAIRWAQQNPQTVFNRFVIFHVRNCTSQLAYPDYANHNVQPIFGPGPFLNAVHNTPQGSNIDFLVRGYDGATTATAGLLNFLRRFASGPGCNGTLNFRFVFFQCREATDPLLANLFGNPRWWAMAQQNVAPAVWALEMGFGARIHQPFTHQTYLNTLGIYHTQHGDPARRHLNSTLTLLYVLGRIDQVKTAGGTAQHPNGPQSPFYNANRNYVPWP